MSRLEKQTEELGEVKIVPATPGDERGIEEVYYTTWLATYPNKKYGVTVADVEHYCQREFSEGGLAERQAEIANMPKHRNLLVAKVGGRIVGVCLVVKHPYVNQLQTIYVLPEYQHQGVGTQLWNEAEKFLDPEKETIVHVAVYNQQAIAFYKKLGFQEPAGPSENLYLKIGKDKEIPLIVLRLPARSRAL